MLCSSRSGNLSGDTDPNEVSSDVHAEYKKSKFRSFLNDRRIVSVELFGRGCGEMEICSSQSPEWRQVAEA